MSWTPQVDRWLNATQASSNALLHLVIAIGELDVVDQVDQGLRWIEQAVERAGRNCGSTDALPEWLRKRRADVRGEEQTSRWQRVVDLLVVAGDTRVSELAD
jgi:hypothetical protein